LREGKDSLSPLPFLFSKSTRGKLIKLEIWFLFLFNKHSEESKYKTNMRSTTTIATVLAAALVMSLCAAQISIPLQKRNIQTDATGYAQETFYTFDLEVLGDNP